MVQRQHPHVHMNYAGDLHNTLENLMHMSEAEDQSVVNELVANKDNRMLDYQFFTGKPDALSTPDHVLHVGEEYRPAFHGHVYFIDLSDFLLSPFASGYEGTAIYSLYPSNTDMLRLAGEQGAFRAYVHPYFGEADPLGGENPTLGSAKAFPVDAALGTVEALEISGAGHAVLNVWHHLLNNDINIVLTGGEDSISSMYRTAIVGQVRSYVYLGDEPLSWDAWLSALRAGRTFATNGPLLDFTIDDAGPGEIIRLPAEGGSITLRGEVRSIVPLDRVMVYHNGRILKEIPLSGEGTEAVFEEEMTVRESGWYTLQAEGSPWTHPIDDRYPLATTQSIRVYVGDDPIRNRDSARYFVRWIDRLIEMAEGTSGLALPGGNRSRARPVPGSPRRLREPRAVTGQYAPPRPSPVHASPSLREPRAVTGQYFAVAARRGQPAGRRAWNICPRHSFRLIPPGCSARRPRPVPRRSTRSRSCSSDACSPPRPSSR